MKKMMLWAAFRLFLTPIAQASEYPEWLLGVLRVENPGKLLYWSSVDRECGITESRFNEVIEEAFTKNRVRPIKVDDDSPNNLTLNISTYCVKDGSDYIFTNEVRFGKYDADWAPFSYDYPFGQFGSVKKRDIYTSIKEDIDDALDAFIESNFQ